MYLARGPWDHVIGMCPNKAINSRDSLTHSRTHTPPDALSATNAIAFKISPATIGQTGVPEILFD